jgi:hypothetical protein
VIPPTITDLHAIAQALGGEVSGQRVLCPGPEHSACDRSLSVKFDPAAPSGLLVHSFAGDDWRVCRDHGHRPAWALGSVGAISFFPVLAGIRRLIILGETGKASADAIKLCGQRWSSARRRVQIIYSEVGSDLNDAVMAAAQ